MAPWTLSAWRSVPPPVATMTASPTGADDARAEVAWSPLHGLATLRAGGRLPEPGMPARVELAHRLLTP